MMELAGSFRIAPPHVIVPWEIKRALVEVLDLPFRVADIGLFGEGVAHAFARRKPPVKGGGRHHLDA